MLREWEFRTDKRFENVSFLVDEKVNCLSRYSPHSRVVTFQEYFRRGERISFPVKQWKSHWWLKNWSAIPTENPFPLVTWFLVGFLAVKIWFVIHLHYCDSRSYLLSKTRIIKTVPILFYSILFASYFFTFFQIILKSRVTMAQNLSRPFSIFKNPKPLPKPKKPKNKRIQRNNGKYIFSSMFHIDRFPRTNNPPNYKHVRREFEEDVVAYIFSVRIAVTQRLSLTTPHVASVEVGQGRRRRKIESDRGRISSISEESKIVSIRGKIMKEGECIVFVI